MTAVAAPLAAPLVPAAAPGARRGAGDSSHAFGRSLAAAADEAAEPGGPARKHAAPLLEGHGVAGLVPDGVAHPGREVAAGHPAGVADGGAGLGALLQGVVPDEGTVGAGAGGVADAGGPEDADGTEGLDGAADGGTGGVVVLDGQAAAVLPVSAPPPAPAPVPSLSAAPADAGLPGTAGRAGAPGGSTAAVGPSAAGPEEQAAVPMPPAGSPASQGLAERAPAPGASLLGSGPSAPAPGVGSVAATTAGQSQGGGAGGSGGGAQQHLGGGLPATAPAVARDSEAAVPTTSRPGADAATTAGPEAPAPSQGVPSPVAVVQAPASTAVGPVATVAAPSPPAPTLHAQVSGPVFGLVGAGDGDHVLTLSVTPDNLGPVTVRAHISGGELRIELFAPHDAGREALRALAAELRRDLAGIAPSASLSVSDAKEAPAQGAPGGGGPGPGGPGDGRADGTGGGPGHDRWQDRPGAHPALPGAATDQTIQPTVDDRTPGATRRLDVLV